MEIGSIVICITLGTLICFVFFGVGVCFGRDSKEQSNGDSCVHSSVDFRSRNRCGDKRDVPPTYEEKIMVLDTFSVGASSLEKRVINSIKEELNRGEDDGK